MRSEVVEVVATTFIDIAEQLTFMLGDRVDFEELPAPDGPVLRASMEIGGDLSGRLDLLIAEAACPELAANILGVEIEDVAGTAQVHDALRETLNVVGGRIVREVSGGDAVFELTPPAVETLEAAAWAVHRTGPARLGFLLDETAVLLGCEITGGGG